MSATHFYPGKNCSITFTTASGTAAPLHGQRFSYKKTAEKLDCGGFGDTVSRYVPSLPDVEATLEGAYSNQLTPGALQAGTPVTVTFARPTITHVPGMALFYIQDVEVAGEYRGLVTYNITLYGTGPALVADA